jgi:hypothetical protein
LQQKLVQLFNNTKSNEQARPIILLLQDQSKKERRAERWNHRHVTFFTTHLYRVIIVTEEFGSVEVHWQCISEISERFPLHKLLNESREDVLLPRDVITNVKLQSLNYTKSSWTSRQPAVASLSHSCWCD